MNIVQSDSGATDACEPVCPLCTCEVMKHEYKLHACCL